MDNANLQRHLAAWNIAAGVLDRERIARLRGMTDADTRAAVARLFSAAPHPRSSDSAVMSGLAEQQRLFRRLR